MKPAPANGQRTAEPRAEEQRRFGALTVVVDVFVHGCAVRSSEVSPVISACFTRASAWSYWAMVAVHRGAWMSWSVSAWRGRTRPRCLLQAAHTTS